MKVENKYNPFKKIRILLVPLDWGLGHATRCIPLINLLIKQQVEVIVAGEGRIFSLLKKEFPNIVILRLKGYNIHYGKQKRSFLARMVAQVPKILFTIRNEHKWLNKVIENHQIDAVISDNRFGLYSKKVPCVFLTHQLEIQTGTSFLNILAQIVNYRYINRFSECWVADNEDGTGLAGQLSHPKKLPGIPTRYLGLLSRFTKTAQKKEIDLLILISGPEPQRSNFEKLLLQQTGEITGAVVLLRGLPGEQALIKPTNKNLSVFNHLPATELNELIQRSKLVLARSGYSTIMDLIALQQPAILVPTPGQTEQEYLAKYLMDKKIFYSVTQDNFSLRIEMENVKEFDYSLIPAFTSINESVVEEFLKTLATRNPV